MDGLSNSDVALLQDRGGMFNGDGMAFWIFALLLLNNGGGFGGNGNVVTNADLAASQNAQTQQLQMQGLSDQIANNRFDLAMAINGESLNISVRDDLNELYEQLKRL
jgi:hypothetical protein